MTIIPTLQPRWASAPGSTIASALRHRGLSVEDLADVLQVPDPVARGLFTGATSIDSAMAECLSVQLGASASFWLTREEQYRESLELVSIDELAARLPLDQMRHLGWMDAPSDWQERAHEVLRYFGVSTMDEWHLAYGDVIDGAKYRASPSFEMDEFAVAAWLRQAEVEADALPFDVGPWSPGQFRGVLEKVRDMTRIADPSIFLPLLQKLCAAAGVQVVVVKAPSGCPVSGASMITRSGMRLIVLSGRHRSDDHLWFTFFHEAGHVLLHAGDRTFVDALDDQTDVTHTETEANEFAQANLIPGGLSRLAGLRQSGPRMREVLAFASRVGVAPGVVVGQLQHDGILEHRQLNGLKRRYKWDGPNLRT